MPDMWVDEEVREKCYKQKGTCDEQGNPRNIVHHIDFNHWNDDPENLIWVSKSEHSSLHGKGANNPFYGKHHSAETLAKMSAKKKGDKNPAHRPEVKAKLSAAFKGRHWHIENEKRVWTD